MGSKLLVIIYPHPFLAKPSISGPEKRQVAGWIPAACQQNAAPPFESTGTVRSSWVLKAVLGFSWENW